MVLALYSLLVSHPFHPLPLNCTQGRHLATRPRPAPAPPSATHVCASRTGVENLIAARLRENLPVGAQLRSRRRRARAARVRPCLRLAAVRRVRPVRRSIGSQRPPVYGEHSHLTQEPNGGGARNYNAGASVFHANQPALRATCVGNSKREPSCTRCPPVLLTNLLLVLRALVWEMSGPGH